MGPALFTTGQSRWALHILVGMLSAVAIASPIPNAVGSAEFYDGPLGDIRGVNFVLGLVGLGGVLVSRTASLLLPKPWRIYLDRLEFTFVAMLWICWTSATMAFSAFTLDIGVCSSSQYEIYLQNCPVLTFDLALLHLLSTSTLVLLLVVLSATLAPSYYLSLSSLTEENSKNDPEDGNIFVMWDLAIASPPPSPALTPTTPASTSYGATDTAHSGQISNPYLPNNVQPSPQKRDKFAEGRVLSYSMLVGCSVGVVTGTGIIITQGDSVVSSILIIVVGCLSLTFAGAFLTLHSLQKKGGHKEGFIRKHGKALEVGLAGILFLIWPLAAIGYTLFPASQNRPCSQQRSSTLDLPPLSAWVCITSSTVVSLAWLASWIMLVRIMGLVFPMPEVEAKFAKPVQGEEGRSLLEAEIVRPQVGYGRIVAGEAFELGEDD